MLRPLIWKEWREQRWKLAFGTVMLLFFTGSTLAAKIASDREIAIVVWALGGLILALYSAMGVFAPERTGGTTTFLTSKPISARRVFLCKWFFGWLNLIVPMLVCSVCILSVGYLSGSDFVRERDIHGVSHAYTYPIRWLAKGMLSGVCMATMFYTMTCCLAPRRGGEALVGFVGLMVLLGMVLHTNVMGHVFPGTGPTFFGSLAWFVNPFCWLFLADPFVGEEYRHSLLVLVQGVVFAGVMWFGLWKWRRSA